MDFGLIYENASTKSRKKLTLQWQLSQRDVQVEFLSKGLKVCYEEFGAVENLGYGLSTTKFIWLTNKGVNALFDRFSL